VATVLRARDGARAGGRTIVAHLGSGASLCAMDAGRSVATTMGFSALDGLIMSTRCGSLDPGIILHLIRERQMSADAVSELLYERSGLLGVSELSGDMQTLLQSADPHASEAVELFVYRIGRQIGSLAAALGGLDTLVFTAGIGENAPIIRQRIGAAAAWLGVDIDPARNGQGETSIGSAASAVEVLVIAADEERAVAEGVMACLG
jgi:acetate kinase